MSKKKTQSKANKDTLRLVAKAKYLESAGTLSLVQLAKEMGVTRQTLAKWKEEDKWDEAATEVKQDVDTKLKKAVAASLFEDLEPEYKEISNNLRVVNGAITQILWKRDRDGRVVRNEDGVPMINDTLSTKEFKHIAGIMATNLRTMRLLAGQSTENIDQETRHTGKVEHEHTHHTKGILDECIEKMETGELGSVEGQEALCKLAEAFQDFREAIGHGPTPQ